MKSEYFLLPNDRIYISSIVRKLYLQFKKEIN